MTARLEAIAPERLLGYPSMLRLLAAEKEAGRLAIAPTAISATSEMLTQDISDAVERAFGVAPSNTFGSSEGLIGVAPPGDPAIVLASDLAIVELVDENDRPVPPGEPSAKVLLTTLFNRAQPLIRYELTDRMTRQPDAPENGHVRVVVEGRADDVFAWGGLHVHPLAVRSVFAKTPEVSEYQVRQTERGIAVAAVAAGALDGEALAKRLRDALAGAGLREPTVTVERVPLIARHPETGKVARFVPLASA
jgi:phenylacetate-coenzyme A ligase PaaK-like adenylate-forming protein